MATHSENSNAADFINGPLADALCSALAARDFEAARRITEDQHVDGNTVLELLAESAGRDGQSDDSDDDYGALFADGLERLKVFTETFLRDLKGKESTWIYSSFSTACLRGNLDIAKFLAKTFKIPKTRSNRTPLGDSLLLLEAVLLAGDTATAVFLLTQFGFTRHEIIKADIFGVALEAGLLPFAFAIAQAHGLTYGETAEALAAHSHLEPIALLLNRPIIPKDCNDLGDLRRLGGKR